MLDDWTTVRSGRAIYRWARRSLHPRTLWPLVGSWLIVIACALGGVAFVADGAILWRAGSPGYALFIGLIAGALGCFAALLVAPAVAALAALTAAIDVSTTPWRPRWRSLWPLPLALAAYLAPRIIIDDYHVDPRGYLLVTLAWSTVLFVLALCVRRGDRWYARIVAVLCGGAAFAADVGTPRALYRDQHDLASLVTVMAVVALLTPWRHRLRVAPARTLRNTLGALLALALGVSWSIEHVRPGWRGPAVQHARYQPRLARALRAVVDFDGDGFSPIAWGGDCDDLDPRRNPLAHEDAVGHDMNCNGYALAAHPTAADRGLAPPAGDPDLPPGSARLVVLLTVDCWSTDAFTPEVMPRLTEYAQNGVVFTRLYSGGSRTHLSLPLLQRPTDRAIPITARLSARGVLSTAVMGYYDAQLEDVVAGFQLLNLQTYERPFHPEIASTPLVAGKVTAEADATALTNRAIQDLRETAGQPHYLWVHYFDAHWPYAPRPASERIAVPAGAPAGYGDYLTEVHHIDFEIGRLLDELSRTGQLARAVVIITADHGEGFGRHGVRYHGISGYDMLVRVPGVLLAPGLQPGVYRELASHRDVPATILGAFGQVAHLPSSESFGRSWLRLRAAPNAPLHRFVVSRSSRAVDVTGFVSPMAAIVEGRLKHVVSFEDGLRQTFDLVDDPGELHDLEPEGPILRLRRDLEIYRDLDQYP
ncbi:MAG TPA: sulfatase-like hydrolase/transferase [Polyangia bacterium]|nr:sulfatase-like hydrolase/transferase [Polyangia bacterium]